METAGRTMMSPSERETLRPGALDLPFHTLPERAHPQLFRDQNRRDMTGNSQSTWTDFKMETPGSFVNRRDTGKSQSIWTDSKKAHRIGPTKLSAASASWKSLCPHPTHHIIKAPWLVNGGHSASLKSQ
jgi:hypothetical protein